MTGTVMGKPGVMARYGLSLRDALSLRAKRSNLAGPTRLLRFARNARGRNARGRDARGRDARGRDARGRDARGAIAFLALALALLVAAPCLAVEPNEQLKNPALEARARAISEGLRCLVCQNETIDESSASLAHDIRVLLRERLTAGDTDEQATRAIVKRYGDFVLLDPPVRPATYVLWFGPFGVLLLGLAGGLAWLRRRSAATDVAVPLSPDEISRLDTILREADR